MTRLPDKNTCRPPIDSVALALSQESLNSSNADIARLAIAATAPFTTNPDLDSCLRQIDVYATRARERLGRARTSERVIDAINTVLFQEEGFAGNASDYYDPRNSFLNEVLNRRVGIPITLSILYLAVARRMGQPFAGIGLPLHFIIKFVGSRVGPFVDPFQGGAMLSEEDCRSRLETVFGTTDYDESLLEPLSATAILTRLLSNLKMVYLQRRDFERAGMAVDQILLLTPGQPDEVRDRGLLYFQERNWSGAARFLLAYVESQPDAVDADEVRQRLEEAGRQRALLN